MLSIDIIGIELRVARYSAISELVADGRDFEKNEVYGPATTATRILEV